MIKKETLGTRFKKWRKENEWTQAQVGEKLKLTAHYFSMLENDKVGISIGTLTSLGKKMNLNLHWLITGKTK